MNTQKTLALLCFVLALAIAGLWVNKGMHLATPEKIQVVETVEDEDGDEDTIKKWVDNPDKLDIGLDYAGPGAGVFGLLGCVLFYLGYKKD
jgi:hypothetical protein